MSILPQLKKKKIHLHCSDLVSTVSGNALILLSKSSYSLMYSHNFSF